MADDLTSGKNCKDEKMEDQSNGTWSGEPKSREKRCKERREFKLIALNIGLTKGRRGNGRIEALEGKNTGDKEERQGAIKKPEP